MAQIKITERPTMLAIVSEEYYGDLVPRTVSHALLDEMNKEEFPGSETPIIYGGKKEALYALESIASLMQKPFTYKMWIMYEEKQVNVEIQAKVTFASLDTINEHSELEIDNEDS